MDSKHVSFFAYKQMQELTAEEKLEFDQKTQRIIKISCLIRTGKKIGGRMP